ncbi:MAG: acyltransferase family protein [Synergistaceae bacterium]|nr:acyltransferase family protein [Synergistaceae bacterium]
MQQEGRKEGRKENFIELEFVRVAACLMVIVLHVAAANFYTFGPHWAVSNTIHSFVRSCVPLFFMISGALLLKKGAADDLSFFIRKRFVRILPSLIFWSSLSCLAYVCLKSEPPVYFFLRFFGTSGFYHLWYLYALVGLYLLIPIVGKWYVNSSGREIAFFLAVWFAACSCSTASSLVSELSGRNADMLKLYNISEFASYIGFFVLGTFLFEERNRYLIEKVKPLAAFLVFVICGLMIAGMTAVYSEYMSQPNQLFYKYRCPLVIIAAVSFFIFSMRLKYNNTRINTLIAKISKYSFGIYCVHAFVLYKIPVSELCSMTGITWLTILLVSIFVFLVSLMISVILKKLPLLSKVV